MRLHACRFWDPGGALGSHYMAAAGLPHQTCGKEQGHSSRSQCLASAGLLQCQTPKSYAPEVLIWQQSLLWIDGSGRWQRLWPALEVLLPAWSKSWHACAPRLVLMPCVRSCLPCNATLSRSREVSGCKLKVLRLHLVLSRCCSSLSTWEPKSMWMRPPSVLLPQGLSNINACNWDAWSHARREPRY